MPHGDCMVRDPYILKCGHPMNWAEMVNELPGDDASLTNAFAALSVSRVGKENQDCRLVRESTKIYGHALKDMQLALYDTERMHSDQVLIASMLLGLYETLEGSALDSRSWLSHAQGAARLIQLRGPERHRNRQAHHVFLGSRVPTLYAAIAQRRATYLASEEWKTIPWENDHRTYYDRLVDAVTRVPGLLEDIDSTNLGTANPLTYSRKLELFKEMAQLQRTIDTWKRNVKKEAVAHCVAYKPVDEDDSYPFEDEMWFSNHLFVHAHCVYWSCSLSLAETAYALIADLSSYNIRTTQAELAAVGDIFSPRAHATCIVKSIRYCLQPDMGALGTCVVNFPANLALRFFRRARDMPVVSWLSRVFKEMRNRGLQYNPQLIEQTVAADSLLGSNSRGITPTIKAESPDGSSDDGSSSKSTESNREVVMIKFVAEDPSKFYLDISNDSS